jgi:hypothetical protein
MAYNNEKLENVCRTLKAKGVYGGTVDELKRYLDAKPENFDNFLKTLKDKNIYGGTAEELSRYIGYSAPTATTTTPTATSAPTVGGVQQPQEEKGFFSKIGDWFSDLSDNMSQNFQNASSNPQVTKMTDTYGRQAAKTEEEYQAKETRKRYTADPYRDDAAYIAQNDEDIRNGKYTLKEEKTDEDIRDNQLALYNATPEGKVEYDKMNTACNQKQNEYFERFSKTVEYDKLMKEYQSAYNAAVGDSAKEEVNKKYNALLNDKLVAYGGEEYEKALEDIYSKYYEKAYNARQNSWLGAQTRLNQPIIKEKNESTLQRVNKSLEDNRKKITDAANTMSGRTNADGTYREHTYPSGGLPWTYNAAYNNLAAQQLPEVAAEEKLLVTAQDRLESNKDLIEAATEGKGFWGGFKDTVGDFDTWTMGLSEWMNNRNVKSVIEKADRGEELTETEQALMDAVALEVMANQYYAFQISRGYKAGQTTGASIPFMIDFMVNPLSGVGRALGKAAVKWGLKRGLAKGATRLIGAGARMGGDLLGATGMTLTTGAGRVGAGVEQRMTGDIKASFKHDKELGTYTLQYDGRENQQDFGTALWNSFADNWIENYSEMVLGVFDGTGNLLRRTFGMKPFGKMFSPKINQSFATFMKGLGNFEKRVQFQGYLGEVSEEYFGNLLRLGMTTDTKAEDVFSEDAQIDTWLGLLPTSVFFGLIGAGGRAWHKGKQWHANRKADNNWKEWLDKQPEADRNFYNMLQERLDAGDIEVEGDVKNYIRRVLADPKTKYSEKEEKLQALAAQLYDKQSEDFQKVIHDHYGKTFDDARGKYRNAQDPSKIIFCSVKDYQANTYRLSPDGSYFIDLGENGNTDERGVPMHNIDDGHGEIVEMPADAIAQEGAIDYDEVREKFISHTQAVAVAHNRFEEGDKIVAEELPGYSATIKGFDSYGVTVEIENENGTKTEKISYEDLVDYYQTAEDKQMEDASDKIDEQSNTSNGHVTNVKIGGSEGTFYVKSGNLVVSTDKDGNPVIDKEKSDGTFVVVNSETGEAKQIGIDQIEAVLGDAHKSEMKAQADENIRQAAYNAKHYPEGSIIYNTSAPEVGLTTVVSTDASGITYNSRNEQTGEVEQSVITNDQRGQWAVLNFEEGDVLQTQMHTYEIVSHDASNKLYTVRIDGAEETEGVSSQELADILTSEQFDTAAFVESKQAAEEQANNATQEGQQEITTGQGENGAPQVGEGGSETAPETTTEEQDEFSEYSDADIAATLEDIKKQLQKQQEIASKPISLIDDKAKAKRAKAQEEIKRLQELYDKFNAVYAQRMQAAEVKRAEEKAAAEKAAQEAAAAKKEAEEAARLEAEKKAGGVPDVSRDSAAAARKRGYRMVNGNVVKRQENTQGVYGKEVEIMFSTQDKPKGRVKVIDASQLQPSHKGGQRNHSYFITEAQPKERTDKASQVAAQKIAENINPQQITEGATAYTGAPVTNTRGEVIQGNNRSIALLMMYDSYPDQAAKYKQYLIDNAERFGLNAEEVAAMQNPVLVTELDVTDEEAIRLGQKNAQDTESGGKQAIDAAKTAQMLGDGLASFARRLTTTDDEEMTLSEMIAANGGEAIKFLRQKDIINDTQYQTAFNDKGELTDEAKNSLLDILRNLLFANAKVDNIREMFARLPLTAQKAILQTVARDANSPADAKVVPYLQEAIEVFYDLQSDPTFMAAKTYEERMAAIWAWAKQLQMDFVGGSFLPAEKFSNFAFALAATFKSQTMATQRAAFNELYDKLQGEGGDLFNATETLTLEQAVEQIYHVKLNNQQNNVTNDGSPVLGNGSKTGGNGQLGENGGTGGAKPLEEGTQSTNNRGGVGGNNQKGEGTTEKPLTPPTTKNEKKGGEKIQVEGEPFPDDISERSTMERTISKREERKQDGFAPSLGQSIKVGFKGDDIFIQIDTEDEDHHSSSQFVVRNAAQKSIEEIADELGRNEIADLDEEQREALKSMLYERAVVQHLQAINKGNTAYIKASANHNAETTDAEIKAAVELSEAPEREFERWLNTLPARDIQKHIAPIFTGSNALVGMRAQRMVEKAFSRAAEREIIDYVKESIAEGNTLVEIKDALDSYVAENIYGQKRISQATSELAAKIAEKAYNEQKGITPDNATNEKQKAGTKKKAAPLTNNEQKKVDDFAKKMTGKGVNLIDKAEDLPKSEGTAYRAIKDGHKVMGWFNIKTGQVYIYTPNARNYNEVMKTLLHEFVSHKGLRDMLGAKKFDELCRNVWKMMPYEQRLQYAVYVTKNIAIGSRKMQAYIKNLSLYESAALLGNEQVQLAAADEYMAHFAEKGITEQNRSLWKTIADAIRDLLRKIGFDVPLRDSDIARLLYESKNRLTQDMSLEEMTNTITNLNGTNSIGEQVDNRTQNSTRFSIEGETLLNVDGKPVIIRQDDGTIEFNLETWRNGDREQMREALEVDARLEPEEADAIIAQADAIADGLQVYMEKYPRFAMMQKLEAGERGIIKDTGSYISVDYSYNCIKKEAVNAVIDALVKAGRGEHLGITQMVAIREVLKKHGYLVPCVLCYVEAKRQILKQGKRDAQIWNAVREAAGLNNKPMGEPTELTAEQETVLKELASGKGLERVKNYTEKSGEGIKADSIKKIATLMLGSDILRGNMNYEWLVSPSLFKEFYNKFCRTGLMEYLSQGQYRGKQLLDVAPFSLNNISSDIYDELFNPVTMGKRGGVRMFSYEDARAIMFFDYYTQFMLLQGARAPLQLYTKRPFMPEMFGLTGAKMNQSLIVDVWEGSEWHRNALGLTKENYDNWLRDNAGFVPRGALSESDVRYKKGSMELVPAWSKESFPVKTAVENAHNRAFLGNVGNVVVAPSVSFIKWALDNSDIHMILPYHSTGANPIMKSLTQLDKAKRMDDGYHTLDKGGKAIQELDVPSIGLRIVGKELQFSSLVRKNKGDARKAAQVYLDYCRENGLTPMFDYEGVTSHENYYKLLADFRMYDEDGNVARQHNVKLTLPENWKEILDKYLAEETTQSEKSASVVLDESVMKEIHAATKYVSIEKEERDSIIKLLSDIYGKSNVEVLKTKDFDERLDKETEAGRAQMLRDQGGMVYGFAIGDKIVLNEDLFNANTPMHEHTHIFMKVLEAYNPNLYARGMELWKSSPMWEEVRNDLEALGEEATDRKIFSECISRFTGAEHENIISKVTGVTDAKWIEKAMTWLREMWQGVKSALEKWTGKDLNKLTAEQFARMPIRALYDEVERKKYTKIVEELHKSDKLEMSAEMMHERGGTRFSISSYAPETDNTLTETARQEMQTIRDETIANGTYMKAPNGKSTNLNERQWLQVRTKAFKKWFGDWENDPKHASQIVDENGEPLVVYHGTSWDAMGEPNGRAVFGLSKTQSQGSYLKDDKQAFFFALKNVAENYGNKEPLGFFINSRTPNVYDVQSQIDEVLWEYDGDASLAEEDGYPLTRWQGNGNEAFEAHDSATAWFDDHAEDIYEESVDNGADAIVVDGTDGSKTIIALSPNQIKSATDNNGDFSEGDNDIRFSITDGAHKPLTHNERVLRDTLADIQRASGLEVLTDEVGQRVLDLINGTGVREQRVYHGTGADFDHFDHSHMSEGEGAQAYGWGTYVTQVEGIAKWYAEKLGGEPRIYYLYKGKQAGEYPLEDMEGNVAGGIIYYWRRTDDLDKAITYFIEGCDALLERTTNEEVRKRLIAKKNIAENIKKEGFQIIEESPSRNLYTVEIPDDNGSNYFDWTAKASTLIERVGISAEECEQNNLATGEDVYRYLEKREGSDKKASMYLAEQGYVGVKYPANFRAGGCADGAQDFVIFNEADAKIVDKVRFFRTANGEAYGFTVGGKIYFDTRIADSETLVHEYTHLWATALQQCNSKEWANIVELMKGTPVWEEVKRTYPELESDNEIADEVLAHYSGRRGAERLREEIERIKNGDGSVLDGVQAIGALERVRKALNKFWKGVADFLHIHFTSAEDVADQVMSDLLNGVNPNAFGVDEKGTRFSIYGGNRGYVGYSKSVRAVEAEEEGKRSVSNFDKEFVDNVNEILQSVGADPINITRAKQLAKEVAPDEWHHTSMYGNKTNYYSPETIARAAMSESQEEAFDQAEMERWQAEQEELHKQHEEAMRQNRERTARAYAAERAFEQVIAPQRPEITKWTNPITGVTTYWLNLDGVHVQVMEDLSEITRKYDDGVDKAVAKKQANQYLAELRAEANAIAEEQINDEESTTDTRFQIIGEQGAANLDKAEEATTRLDNLQVARDMEQAGKDAKAIRLATGWERGADGKWRYEIPDIEYVPTGDAGLNAFIYAQSWGKELHSLSDRIFNEEKLSDAENERFHELCEKAEEKRKLYYSLDKKYLTDYVQDKELFNAYPRLKTIEVRFVDRENTYAGGYNNETNTITLNANSLEDTKSTLAHEIQHAIQRIEGFAKGGNMNTVRKELEQIVSENTEDAEYATQAKEEFLHLAELAGLLKNVYSKLINSGIENYEQLAVDMYWDAMNELGNNPSSKFLDLYDDLVHDGETPTEVAKLGRKIPEAIDELNRLADERKPSKTMMSAKKLVDKLNATLKDYTDAQLYNALAGEVESRNVQKRLGMTEEQRRNTLLQETEDVAREDQIFLQEYAGVNELSSTELYDKFGNRWLEEQTNEDGRHTTQVRNTISSYQSFGDWVKKDANGKKVSVLDASSGLGMGTELLNRNGIDTDDVEPYPSSNRTSPTYRSYDEIDKKYDYIISNAVLNVIPDDWRTDLLHNMAGKLKIGGKMVINVRGAHSIETQGKEGITKITLGSPSEILVLRPNGSIRAYQKGFTKQELKEWCAKELGADYAVDIATKKNAGSNYDTAVVITKNNESNTIGVASEAGHPHRSVQPMPNSTAKVDKRNDIVKGLNKILSTLINNQSMGQHEFLFNVARAFGFNERNLTKSYYASLGNSVGIRVADHYANAKNIESKNENDTVYGLVVKLSNSRFRDKDGVDYLEYVYFPDKMSHERQIDVINGLKTFVETGDFAILPAPDKTNSSGRFKDAIESADDIRFSIETDEEFESEFGMEGAKNEPIPFENVVGKIQPDEGLREYALRMNAMMNGYSEERMQQVAELVNKRMERGGKWYAKLYRHLYDKYYPLDRFQKALAEQGALLDQRTDAYSDIFRSMGRATTQFQKFYDERFKPLTTLLRSLIESKAVKNFKDVRWADKKTMSERDKITLYLRAKDMVECEEKGLVERGAAGFADFVRHADNALQGWTPQEYVAAFEAAIGKENVSRLWERVNAVNKFSLDYMQEHGFVDEKLVERYKEREFYVPQRGFEEGESHVDLNALRKAEGRKSLSADPLPFMAGIAEQTIMSVEKNRTKQKMLQFAIANMRLGKETGTFDIAKVQYRKTGHILENGLPEYEAVYDGIPQKALQRDAHYRREIIRIKEFLKDENLTDEQREEYLDKIEELEDKIQYASSVRYDQIRPEIPEKINQNRVDVWQNGKHYSILFADRAVADALNRKDGEMGRFVRFLNTSIPFIQRLTQYFSRILTQQNPAFALWNLLRDTGLGFHTNLLEHPSWVGAYSKNLARVQKAVAQYAFAGKYADSNIGKYLQEYFNEGAQTGFSFVNGIEDLQRQISRELKRGNKLDAFVNSNFNPLQLFSNITEWSELTVRVAQYVTAREHGYTPEQAATEAKEVSTNFDRRGNLRLCYNFYSFFNAAMQGTNKHIRQVMNEHGKGLAVSLALLMGAGLLNALLAPDDPDDEMGYTEFDRMQNICLGRIRIPLPPGLRAFWALGVQAALAMQGRKTWNAALVDGATFLFSEIMPINVMGGFDVSESTNRLEFESKLAFREFIPTGLQPLYDLANNTTFNGSTVYREPYLRSQDGKIPQTMLGKRNVNGLIKLSTDKLFELGGGDLSKKTLTKSDGTQVSGFFDVNPSKVEYLIKSATGGTGQFVVDLFNTGYNAFTNNINSFDDFAATMPVIKRAWKPYKEEKEAVRDFYILKGRIEAAKKAEGTMPRERKKILREAERAIAPLDRKGRSPEKATKKQLMKMHNIIIKWNENYW